MKLMFVRRRNTNYKRSYNVILEFEEYEWSKVNGQIAYEFSADQKQHLPKDQRSISSALTRIAKIIKRLE